MSFLNKPVLVGRCKGCNALIMFCRLAAVQRDFELVNDDSEYTGDSDYNDWIIRKNDTEYNYAVQDSATITLEKCTCKTLIEQCPELANL